jgi:hypothetical protein
MSADELAAELAKTRKALKQANSEAQKNREARKRLEELEAEEERRRQESLSEDEKRKARLAQLETKAREAEERAEKLARENLRLKIDREVIDEAKRQGVPRPEMIPALVRGNDGMGIEVDPESGKTLGVKDAVQKLLKEYPDLLEFGGVTRGRGTPPRMDSPYRLPPRSGVPPRSDAEKEAELAEANDRDLINRIPGYGRF